MMFVAAALSRSRTIGAIEPDDEKRKQSAPSALGAETSSILGDQQANQASH